MTDTMKHYQIGMNTPQAWEELHILLCNQIPQDPFVPSRAVVCSNDMGWVKTSGVYLLTEQEAQQLAQHPQVSYLHLDPDTYPELFRGIPIEYI
jgi:hypothetical protein